MTYFIKIRFENYNENKSLQICLRFLFLHLIDKWTKHGQNGYCAIIQFRFLDFRPVAITWTFSTTLIQVAFTHTGGNVSN